MECASSRTLSEETLRYFDGMPNISFTPGQMPPAAPAGFGPTKRLAHARASFRLRWRLRLNSQ
jgi:hypothetical protein